jgi:polyisoprenoid-binding protein YceI
MSMLSRTALAAAALGLAVAPQALQAAETYTMDPPHTQVTFGVSHLGYSTVYGRFNEEAGTVTFDEDDPSKSSVEVTIQAASVDTGYEARDQHLRSPDFFNAEEFPEITFESTKIEKTGENTGRMTGDLTLLGVTKPVTLDVTFNKAAPNPMGQAPTVGFSARGTVKRSDFGMTYGQGGIGDEVELIVEVEAKKQ